MTPKSCYVWIALALALYLFFSLTWLGLPGLYYDETNFVNAALGATSGSFIAWSAEVFGKKVPIMIMEYIGALKSGFYAPIFKIFGCSAVTARLPVVLIGLITLLASYALFRRMFDRTIAVVALLLFASDCTFIFANRLDWGPVSLMLALEMAALYFMWRWIAEGNNRFLAVAGFLFGLGLYNKIIFAWFLAAFFAGLLLCYRNHLKRLLHWRRLAWFIPAFLLGCSPLIAFNISMPMATFQRRSAVTIPGSDDLQRRFLALRGTLDGSGVYFLVNQSEVSKPSTMLTSPPKGNPDRVLSAVASTPWIGRSPLPLAFVVSAVLIPVLTGRRAVGKKREILFLASHIPAIAILICLNKEATGAHHMIALYPFIFILIAWAVCELARWLGRSPMARGAVMGACLLPLLAANIVTDARYLKSFQAKGGHGGWSDAVYDLGDFVRRNPDKKYVLMEWGFTTPLILLSNGRMRYEEFVCADENAESCMESIKSRRNACFVFHTPPFANTSLLGAFKTMLDRNNLHGRILKTFYQRDGSPIYVVYQIAPLALTAPVGNGGFFYQREGEDYDGKAGGDLDRKKGASREMALGNYWGRGSEDFVAYNFSLPADLASARLSLRYAFEDQRPHQYFLFLDGNYLDAITLPATPGYGYTADQWKAFEISLGVLEKGAHELMLKPAGEHQLLNLDYWRLREKGNREGAKDAKER